MTDANCIDALDDILSSHHLATTNQTSLIERELDSRPPLAQLYFEALELWSQDTSVDYRLCIRDYFDYINPYCNLQDPSTAPPYYPLTLSGPCCSASQFYSSLGDCMNLQDTEGCFATTIQFLALAHLIIALMKILDDQWVDNKLTPGWKEYEVATTLLSYQIGEARHAVLTIQCLILKCTYLVYLAQFNKAHDIVCQAVRLCFQHSLNDQRRWPLALLLRCICGKGFFGPYSTLKGMLPSSAECHI